jgi:hypothetical protein
VLADLLIVGLTILAAWRGAKRGLLRSLAGFGGTIAAVIVALLVYRATESAGTAFGALLVVAFGLQTIAHLLTRAVRHTMLGRANMLSGAALGGAWALAWLALAIIALRVAPFENELTRSLRASQFADAVVRAEAGLATRHSIASWLEDLLGGPAAISLRASDSAAARKSTEAVLFDLANRAREAVGAPALEWDGDLAAAGRAHVAELYRRGAFTHVGADGSSPGDRLKERRIPFSRTGENLALAPNAIEAHQQLMASPRHRAHLLDPAFTRIGIGAVFGDQGVLVAQEFAA